ncbi:MAG: quinolinate synthase NadA [Anaerolineae bacterium]
MSGERRVGWVPDRYLQMSNVELVAATAAARAQLGDRVAILGHHYQRDEIIQFADYAGDSLELSRRAASVDSQYIVFCGVYFMAETAAVLCAPDQTVIQPVIEALCPMAEMASGPQVAKAWDALSSVWQEPIVPITYQNSNADIKAFVGERGGAVCTSSNARRIFEWAFGKGGRILFIPDEHLGTNTALDMGLSQSELGVWNPLRPPHPETLRDCRVVVWRGFCSVHTGFEVEDVQRAREQYPGASVIVHPECPRPVVVAADAAGSTSFLIDAVKSAPAGATIVIGTECHLVDRLSRQHPDKLVVPLARRACGSMGLTRLVHLTHVLDGLVEGVVHNVVTVPPEIAVGARMALEKMLQ